MNKIFRPSILLLAVLLLNNCGVKNHNKKIILLQGHGQKSVLLTGIKNPEALKAQAEDLGLNFEGNFITRISGDAELIRGLDLSQNGEIQFIEDESVKIDNHAPFSPQQKALYLAKKDFGILDFWKKRPQADGREVVVGILDDGISPHQSGFFKTSTGARKFLKRGSNSSYTTFSLNLVGEELWEGQVVEDRPYLFSKNFDLNQDNEYKPWNVKVVGDKICLDLNIDGAFLEDECRGSFAATGEYFVLPKNLKLAITAEFDKTNNKLKIFQPEEKGDSHGEGVASVLSGYQLGGLKDFDGVAPGSKILDFDLSEKTDKQEEDQYTLGRILMGMDWLGANGAEVVNLSYSLFFSSIKSQIFMRQAVSELSKKYNMVITFSAGNNGPGLGSLNRRSIYPSSSLVAGAFVSKELDEVVHGVTGLPEEGRVIFYSSRGPGPLNEDGALLIAPLSSLVHSDPQGGFDAFSGTSSASPALAGVATVLISALKQEGIKIDAETIVHALRLSGRLLKNEPFVAQGYGLPQIERAFEIYKKLVAGDQVMNVTVKAVSEPQIDGSSQKGLFYFLSQTEWASARIELSGILSPLAPASSTINLLTPIDLEYSKGIRGPKSLWISASESTIDLDINVLEMLSEGQDEAFGEISIKDQATGVLLGVVPVTAIRDYPVLKKVKSVLTVGPEQGARLHLNVSANVLALRVRYKILEGSEKFLRLSAYDPNRIRTLQKRFTDELWVPIDQAGHHQFALAMSGGTSRKSVVEFEVTPIEVELLSINSLITKPTIRLKNNSSERISAVFSLVPVDHILKTVMGNIDQEIKPLETELLLEKKGTYKLEMALNHKTQIAYEAPTCSGQLLGNDGVIKSFTEDLLKKTDDLRETWKVRCIPFEQGIKKNESLSWHMTVKEQGENENKIQKSLLRYQENDLEFKAVNTPGKYQLWMSEDDSSKKILIGNVELF